MILKLLREALGRIIVFISFITRPAKIVRSDAEQGAVNEAAKGLSLYQFYACPFCVRTRRAIHRLNVPIEYRDAQNNPVYRSELLKEGGEIKVPCLKIEEKGRTKWMYESGDIIQYLNERFGPKNIAG
jgi:glutaredoxin